MHICMKPDVARVRGAPGGIPRVVEAYVRGLQERGHEFVTNELQADVTAVHAGERNLRRQPDVAMCHGLYPTGESDFGPFEATLNAAVVENLRTSKTVMVPSSWVADILRRDMHLRPYVVPHGIWTAEYEAAGDPTGPIVWAKTRVDAVCDPSMVLDLAESMPDKQFWSVARLNQPPTNVKSTGAMPHKQYLDNLKACSVYLATTKETGRCFGAMEALAMGVPCVGYATGSNTEYLPDGSGSVLVAPGDVSGLQAVLEEVLSHWDLYHAQALEFAKTLDWQPIIDQVEAILKGVTPDSKQPLVSIVIPCHNYARFVKTAIDSALSQTWKNIEIVVIDDASTDGSQDVIKEYGDKVKAILLETNIGVAQARNTAIEQAHGEFIVCLDADDELYPYMVDRLLVNLIRDRGAGIAYGPIVTMTEDGRDGPDRWFVQNYDFDRVVAGANFVPSCCMFRKEAWRRAGGYRSRYATGEDGDFWLRIVALGWRAIPVDGPPAYRYRRHSASISVQKPKDDWYTDKMWWTSHYFAGGGNPRQTRRVRNYDPPEVDVVLTVAPGQEWYVPMALDSVEAQDYYRWQVTLVDLTGGACRKYMSGFPFVRYVESAITPTAPRVLYLSPVEWLVPGQLREMVHAGWHNGVRYTEWPMAEVAA